MRKPPRGRPDETAARAAAGPSPEVIDALYRALLGRASDADGTSFWSTAESVDAVINGLTATPEHRQRVVDLATGYGGDATTELSAVTRLRKGDGLVALDETGNDTLLKALEMLPMSDLTRGLPDSPTVRVLGPYAEQLAEELRIRHAVTATAGLGGTTGHDVLVVTDAAYVRALRFASPSTLDGIRLRLACPVRLDISQTTDASAALLTRRRLALHRLGFIEVVRVYRRRFGDVVAVVDVSHITPDFDHPRLAAVTTMQPWTAPDSFWLIANRIPLYDRVECHPASF